MSGRPQVAGGRPELVTVRLSPAEAAKLDRLRRGFSRGLGLRELLRKAPEPRESSDETPTSGPVASDVW
jgi:hypothetical protein